MGLIGMVGANRVMGWLGAWWRWGLGFVGAHSVKTLSKSKEYFIFMSLIHSPGESFTT